MCLVLYFLISKQKSKRWRETTTISCKYYAKIKIFMNMGLVGAIIMRFNDIWPRAASHFIPLINNWFEVVNNVITVLCLVFNSGLKFESKNSTIFVYNKYVTNIIIILTDDLHLQKTNKNEQKIYIFFKITKEWLLKKGL